MKNIYASLILFLLASCMLRPEPEPLLLYLPTFTPTLTTTPTPTLTPIPETTNTPTHTPEPWLQIDFSISNASTGQAVTADVYVGVVIDAQTAGELFETNVSETVFHIPRGLTHADGLFITVVAEGYPNRLIRLPLEAKTEPALSFEVQLEKSER